MSAGAPLRGTRNVAGPEVFTLDELGRITLGRRAATVAPSSPTTRAGVFAAVSGDALIAKDGAVIAEDHLPGVARPRPELQPLVASGPMTCYRWLQIKEHGR